MAQLIILSQNPHFAETLGAAAAKEFGADSAVAASEKAALEASIGAALLVSDMPVSGEFPLPVIMVSLPVRLSQLLVDIAAALAPAPGQVTLALGKHWQLSSLHKSLTHVKSQASVELTDKEINILQLLAENPGKVVAKEQLLKTVWGIDSALDTHTLETHIYRLRNKLRDVMEQDAILAQDGGYKLDL